MSTEIQEMKNENQPSLAEMLGAFIPIKPLTSIVEEYNRLIRFSTSTVAKQKEIIASKNFWGYSLHSANLDKADLSNVDLSYVDLTGANLNGVNLTNANLTGATLNKADLTDAVLNDANLTKAKAHRTKFKKAKLDGADFTDADLLHADLTSVKSSSLTKFVGANLRRAELTAACLIGVDLSRANLSGAELNANLTKANLSRANLSDTDLSGAILEGANLSGTDLSRTILEGANLSAADLTDAIVTHAVLSDKTNLTNTIGFNQNNVNPPTSLDRTDTRTTSINGASHLIAQSSAASTSSMPLTTSVAESKQGFFAEPQTTNTSFISPKEQKEAGALSVVSGLGNFFPTTTQPNAGLKRSLDLQPHSEATESSSQKKPCVLMAGSV